jgi:hypothetical protein
VNFQADAVACAVEKILGKAGLLQDAARGGIDIGGPDARAHGGQTCLFGAQNGLIHAARPLRAPADENRSRNVRAIALPADAEVDENRVTGAQTPPARMMVRLRGIRARRHKIGKGFAVRFEVFNSAPNKSRHVDFAHSRFRNAIVRAISSSAKRTALRMAAISPGSLITRKFATISPASTSRPGRACRRHAQT